MSLPVGFKQNLATQLISELRCERGASSSDLRRRVPRHGSVNKNNSEKSRSTSSNSRRSNNSNSYVNMSVWKADSIRKPLVEFRSQLLAGIKLSRD